jgi:hypothetical protein
MTDDLIAAVMRYDDGIYLHQTIVRGPAGLTRYVDLPDAVAAFKGGRADLEATLAALRRKSRSSHLEVESYTWDVLPDHLRTGSKAADIAREISFCVKELAG